MKKFVSVLAVVLFTFPVTTLAKPAQQSEEIKVLNQWLGAWENRIVIKPSVWIADKEEFTGTKNVEWFLDGHFQQATSQNPHETTYEIFRYDHASKLYQRWSYNSEGITSFWTGAWDKETNTLTWQMEFSPHINGYIKDRFVGANTYKTEITLTDRKGTLLLDILIESTRVESGDN